MSETRIKISSIIENQLPQFVKEEFPLASEFLSQYYVAMENQGGVSDILQNIDQYIKVDNLVNLVGVTTLSSDITSFDSTVPVKSTAGFPDSYGLLLIDNEIITYTSKTDVSFEGCVRGFSGITSYDNKKDELTFTETESSDHVKASNVTNLSILFLKEFLMKVKKQITPGFENKELYSKLNERLFIKQAIDFYSSKGTDNSFKILFKALYGENVDVIKPRDYLIEPSSAQYRITSDLVVEAISGNPKDLVNGTLYQNKKDFVEAAQGTITNVEKIRRDSKDYYIISLDYDYDKDIKPTGTVLGEFTIHPKTKIISDCAINSSTINVDSTVSFPNENGSLIVDLENGTSLTIKYASKTLNQFLQCTGVEQNIPAGAEIKYDVYAYGYDTNGLEVQIRILGVLSKLKIPTNTTLYSKGDTIKIKTLGIDLKEEKYNNWFFNIPSKYEVSSIELLDISDKSYKINTVNSHTFKIGDLVTLLSSDSLSYSGRVRSTSGSDSFVVQFGSQFSLLNNNLTYSVKKTLNNVNSLNYPSINVYTSNVQNVYFEQTDQSFYVAAPSLPTYLDYSLDVTDRSITFSGTFTGKIINLGKEHGLYTGDSIVYKPQPNNSLGISTGIYFVKKVDNYKIKLSRSRSNIFNDINDQNFIDVNGTVTNAKFELTEFTYKNLSTQLLESQKLIRKISEPKNESGNYETSPGLTGIFVNGVEVLNYKSFDNVYYGPIQEIIPTSAGDGYDVINPPILEITDPIGSDAEGYCSIIGNLQRIDIVDQGFDYLEEPTIAITGGNGYGAAAKANLISFDHQSSFSSEYNSQRIQLTPVNTIGFSTYHKFRDNEEVIYITNNQTGVGGLSTNSTYAVSVIDEYTVSLYKSTDDSASKSNPIELTSYGNGVHILKSKNKKRKIGSISIQNSGTGYQNKLTSINSSGVSTFSDIITIKNHGYSSGEIVRYDATEIPIGGLSSATSYYLTKIDENQFKLSKIGLSTSGVTTSFYYDTNQYVDLTHVGTGTHKFNYPEIKVTIEGRVGVNTFTNTYYQAILQPIFRGQVHSVFVNNGGQKYGSEEIINYNRQPTFNLNSGSGADIVPIISNGQIIDVLINKVGKGYNSPPDIQVNGNGVGAILVPILSNGELKDVKVLYSGSGYEEKNTVLDVIPSGSNAKFESKIKSWKINLVERLIQNKQINSDDGILTSGLNSNYGLEYTHAYAPKYLRTLVQGVNFIDGKRFYSPDLQLVDNTEILSNAHSPIIGWAYDGNPIYGPYGYSSDTGSPTIMRSGYEYKKLSDRPSESIYKPGFFVEDYVYVGSGDLDDHNGRFCITPDYPNGVYAYFTTISPTLISQNYRSPVFPYVIGNSYKSKPIDFNFKSSSNQDNIDINETGWLRNTTPYNITEENNVYEYFPNLNNSAQTSKIKDTLVGTIDSIQVIDGGQNYKVNDFLTFTAERSESRASGKVSLIKGKNVTQISVATSSFDDVMMLPYQNEYIAITTVPHNYTNTDLVTFTGKYDYKKFGNITINSNQLILTSDVASISYTGIVTYFNVSGNLNDIVIMENDIYQVGNEEVKIITVDRDSSRIKVFRNQNNISGTHSAGIAITEKSRKFGINFGITTSYNFDINRQLYFDPAESVGIGTSSGVGIVSTIYFSNPGVGITQTIIPTQSIYIKNHGLKTGDSLIYSSNGGSRISVSTNGYSSFQLPDNSAVYASKISNDLIGISTIKVGLGSTGTFVSTSSNSSNILYFTSVGTGNTHSFRTNYSNILSGNVSKNVVTVSTAETHGLSLGDNVIVNVKSGITTAIKIKYDDSNRRLLVNPRTFTSINVENSTIYIKNHKYFSGQKILCTTSSIVPEITSDKLYYVVVFDSNRIKLSNSYFDATKNIPNTIELLNSVSGTISEVNPTIKVLNNQPIVFDLSDSSLSFVNNSTSYSAFDFKLYEDPSFNYEFNTTKNTPNFEIVRDGNIGIDSFAKVTVYPNSYFPKVFYYNLIPINLNLNPKVKVEIFTDKEVNGYNKISFVDSLYNGSYQIKEVRPNSFQYNVLELPEILSYNNNVEYYTDSHSAKGPIQKIKLTGKGKYSKLPSIISITSLDGKNAQILPTTKSIGKVNSVEIEDIGFDYSSDLSIRPIVKYPEILKLQSLNSFDYIGITSIGKNYIFAPNLVTLDGLSNQVIDVELKYSLNDKNVTIIKNSKTISDYPPRIVPTNNSNGFKIKNIEFDNNTKDVVVSFASSFSAPSDFPFEVGDKVLIEGVSVGLNTEGKGYNSSNYDYSLFVITNKDGKIGGIGASITYNLNEYLDGGEYPGTFNSFYSSGRVIPESYLPTFDPVLKKNDFIVGEYVYSPTSNGIVENWDPTNSYLKVSTNKNFLTNELVVGRSSFSVGIISSIIKNDSEYVVDSTSIRKKTWNKETGFLNNDFQRVHDNDYYQYFSYSLRSKKDIGTWNDTVSSLNHTAGFKKFGNLIVESIPTKSRMSTDQNAGDFKAIVDMSRVIDVNCIVDFDLASENNLPLEGRLSSNEIYFNSRIIQDFIESIGNRVLTLDDISNQFNSNPRPTEYSVVDSFLLGEYRGIKYIILTKDKNSLDLNDHQLTCVTLVYDEYNGFLNQYGVETNGGNLGFFDFDIYGNTGNLLFYPKKPKFNDYDLKILSFNFTDIGKINPTGIGSTTLGDSIIIDTNSIIIPQGTSSAVPIVGIATTYRSAKILVQIGSTVSPYYALDEITYIHDGSTVYSINYGQITSDKLSTVSSPGFGTLFAYISGSEVIIDLIPNQTTTVDYVVSTINVNIADSSLTGIGTEVLGSCSINSSSVRILPNSSPTPVMISKYSNLEYQGSYSIISIEDLTNFEYQISEFLTITNPEGCNHTEYGVVLSNYTLGMITSEVVGTDTYIYFTPNNDTEVDIKVFQANIGLSEGSTGIDFVDGSINSSSANYTGTYNDVRKEFNLTYNNSPIFEKYFNSESLSVVNIGKNIIRIPNHFMTTGEEIVYSYPGYGTTQAIGIAETSIPGIGLTDKLPSTLYVVKVNDLDIRVAASASEALRTIPHVLELTSVGIGSSHLFTSKNQNSKSLISIDNNIQSPVLSSDIQTDLTNIVQTYNTRIFVSDAKIFSNRDLIKIDDEIMQIVSIGVGSPNTIYVNRGLLGTQVSTHSISSKVIKIFGNYNIVRNKLYFIDPPYGKIPLSDQSSRPDEKDYIGITTSSSFSGRVFLRSGVIDDINPAYYDNYIFDDISNKFDGSKNTFTLKYEGNNVTGISTDNAIILINEIFQAPNSSLDTNEYYLSENSGITSITFMGSPYSVEYDINSSSVPRGGIIVSVGSSQGFGYQPLVAAGGTAIVSSAGTIGSIAIGNSGSGYRSGIQTTVNVGVTTENTINSKIEYIGIASVNNGRVVSVNITNPGSGYTFTNPPRVIFDSPLSYSDIPLIYSQHSSGIGTEATVDIIVGQGSSVISFELKNLGYSYKKNEILTVSIGGTTGIPTTSSPNFSEFQIIIDGIDSDKFAGWHLGNIQPVDSIEYLFDGKRTLFPINVNSSRVTIKSKRGSSISNVDLQSSLIIFLNDILQVPGKGYTFNGGSVFKFTEPPRPGDRCRVLFYKGTRGVDTQNSDILETIKIGDKVTLRSDDFNFNQGERLVEDIISSDAIETNLYFNGGVSPDEDLLRPLMWCKQTEDLFVNGLKVGKDRIIYEPYIYPSTNIITNVGLNTGHIFVENVKTFFDSDREYTKNGTSELPQNKIMIISQESLVAAAGTVVVSSAGTITNIVLSENGSGYTTSPTISISNPTEGGTLGIATAIITNGSISSINILYEGSGYDPLYPPSVLFESPKINSEVIDKVSYQGDFGIITGINTISTGIAQTGLVFDLFVPQNSYLRSSIAGVASTGISGIQTGYYFVVNKSNVGNGLTSLDTNGSVVGIGTSFVDNIYQAVSVSIGQTLVSGIGMTNVTKVVVSLADYNGISGLGFSSFYGDYSWGKISIPNRLTPKEFFAYNNSSGISTFPVVKRVNRLKYLNFNT